MQMIESLQTGQFGVELRLPSHLHVRSDEEQRAELVDESNGVMWRFFFFPDLHLDLCEEHRADLRRSLEWYARSMFDDVFRQRDHMDGRSPPRTTDPSWSPLVDVEHLSIGGARALRTVHRMTYEPGSEIIMGHLLIPLRRGLFEARTVCGDQMTGYRESVLIDRRMGERPPSSKEDIQRLMAGLQQSDFDDPRHDDVFPQHSLSRTRAAIRWLCTESELHLTELPSPFEHGEVELSHLDCVLVPPPRFAYELPGGPSQEGSFCRVSFCGTDGVELLHVKRWDLSTRVSASNLPRVAESIARETHEVNGVKNIRVAGEVPLPLDQRPQALVVVEGTGHLGALRNAMIFFLDEDRRLWSLSRFGMAAVPRDAMVADLEGAVRSFRLVRRSKEPKPW